MKPMTAAVLRVLEDRGERGITPLEALEVIGTFRLGARIWELKRDGWPIETDMVKTPSGKRIARYRLAA